MRTIPRAAVRKADLLAVREVLRVEVVARVVQAGADVEVQVGQEGLAEVGVAALAAVLQVEVKAVAVLRAL